MWIKPAVAGAAIVTGLALAVGAGGASPPVDTSLTTQVDQTGRDHDNGRKHSHDKHDKSDKPDKSGKSSKPDKSEKHGRRARPEDAPRGNGPPPHVTLRPDHPRHGKACIRPANYEGGPLEACPWQRSPKGMVVPAEPQP